jgi:hypothetical protein
MNPTKEKTTILFVNKGPQNLKPLQVSSNLLLNWKRYLAALSLFFLCLISTIIFLAINNIEQHKSKEILSQRINSINTKFAEADSSVLRKKITNIDRQLSAINDFLKARGIQTVYRNQCTIKQTVMLYR